MAGDDPKYTVSSTGLPGWIDAYYCRKRMLFLPARAGFFSQGTMLLETLYFLLVA
jgi:hypothetical protein